MSRPFEAARTSPSQRIQLINIIIQRAAAGILKRHQTQHKRPNVTTALFIIIIIGVFNAKGSRFAQVYLEGAPKKVRNEHGSDE